MTGWKDEKRRGKEERRDRVILPSFL